MTDDDGGGRSVKSQRRRSRLVRCLRLGVGVTLLVLLGSYLDWARTLALLGRVQFGPALLGILALFLAMVISSVKWRVLLIAQGIQIRCGELIGAYWIATFFSNYLPTNIGGDITRLGVLRGRGTVVEGAASILLERGTGFAVILTLAAIGLFCRPQYFEVAGLLGVLWALVIGCFVAAVGGTVLALKAPAPTNSSDVAAGSGLVAKIRSQAGKLSQAMLQYRDHKVEVFVALLFSLPFYFFVVVFQYLLFVALGYPLPWQEVFFVAPIIPLVSLLPVSVNSLGISDGAFVLFYSQLGLEPEQAMSAALLRRVLQLGFSSWGGVVWLLRRPERGVLVDS